MALIACQECGTEVSDKAVACPKCGFPIAQVISTQLKEQSSQSQKQQEVLDHRMLQEYVVNHLDKDQQPISLRSVNGVGFKMYGFYPLILKDQKTLGLSLHTFCFLFIPIIPLGLYLNETQGDSYRFYGSVPIGGCVEKLGIKGSLRLARSILGEALVILLLLMTVVIIGGFLVTGLRSWLR